jgi:acetyltransferase-like isoleucine patch superfamily enzyme
VTKSVEPYTIVAGSPARLLRALTETEQQEHRQR